MVHFSGEVSRDVKEQYFVRKNFNKGIKYLIWVILLSAPIMLAVLMAFAFNSIGDNTNSAITFNVFDNTTLVGLLAGAVVLYIVLFVKMVSNLVFPKKKKDIEKNITIDYVITENGFYDPKRKITYKLQNVRKVYDGGGYFEIYRKKNGKQPLLIDKSLLIEGTIDDFYSLLQNKVKKLKVRSKEADDKNYKYLIIGASLSLLLAALTIPGIKVGSYLVMRLFDAIITGFLIPFGEKTLGLLSLSDDVWENIVLDVFFMFWIFLAINIVVWSITIGVTLYVVLLIYPMIIAFSLILPLKQLTINRKKLSYLGVLFSVLMIITSIVELILFAGR